jgi:hypothetical protein
MRAKIGRTLARLARLLAQRPGVRLVYVWLLEGIWPPVALILMSYDQGADLIFSALFVTLLLFYLPWDMLSCYLQGIWLLGLLILLVVKGAWLVSAAVVVFWLVLEWRSRRNVGRQPLNLASPVAALLAVRHGGHSLLTNYHAAYPIQSYALDLAVVDRLGRSVRRGGLFPRHLTTYRSFGQAVLAPCDGVVLTCQDGLPDLPVGQMDPERPAGNHVVIQVSEQPGILLLLAHLQSGSLCVEPGQCVRAGEPLGRIGNSGNTSEPHLHLHAQELVDGQWRAVPLTLAGRRVRRNSLIFPSHAPAGFRAALAPLLGQVDEAARR